MPLEAIVNAQIRSLMEPSSPQDRQMIEITLHGISAAPQGSGRAMLIGGKARFIGTSSNAGGKRLRAYRGALSNQARQTLIRNGKMQPWASKHVPLCLEITFFFVPPKSMPKKRRGMVVTPDVDKCIRSTLDSLTGILFHDDAQVVSVVARKLYASFEGVRVVAEIAKEEAA